MKALRVINPGPQSLIEDLGRYGFTSLGVGRSGAMDRAAFALANRLVGNPKDSAVIEILLGGAEFEAQSDLWIAVTGAWGVLQAANRPAEPNCAIRLESGDKLSIPFAEHGIRYYLAVRGGIEIPETLGSRSTDTLADLGPQPLRVADELSIGISSIDPIPVVDVMPVRLPPQDAIELEIRPGPRRGWFGPESWSRLFSTNWIVSPRSDRRGIRLEGAALSRVKQEELLSEGAIPGAIQVSPDGVPTILGVDHPVTGGYPVIAVVTDDTVDRLAQARPGQQLRLVLATGR